MIGTRRTVVFRTLGVTLLLGGGLGLWALVQEAHSLATVWPQAVAAGQVATAWANAAILGGFGLIILVGMLGGRDLLLSRTRGRWLCLVAIVPQALAFSLAGIQYRFALLGFFGVGAVRMGEHIRFGFMLETGTQLSLGFETISNWHAYLNVGAVAALGLLSLPFGRAHTSDTPEEKCQTSGEAPQ
jgi:hypothetical protein